MAPRVLIAALLVAGSLAGCGQEASSADFEGAEQEVADVIEELQTNAEQRETEEICTRLLTQELQQTLSAGDSTCASQLEKAFNDTDSFDLAVEDVTISGDSATARVRAADEADGIVRTFELARSGDTWRISGFGSPQG